MPGQVVAGSSQDEQPTEPVSGAVQQDHGSQARRGGCRDAF